MIPGVATLNSQPTNEHYKEFDKAILSRFGRGEVTLDEASKERLQFLYGERKQASDSSDAAKFESVENEILDVLAGNYQPSQPREERHLGEGTSGFGAGVRRPVTQSPSMNQLIRELARNV